MDTVMRRVLVAVIALFVVIVGFVAAVIVPLAADSATGEYPELRYLATPYEALTIAALICFQIAAILVALILGRQACSEFFTPRTRTLIGVTGVLCVLGFTMPAGVAAHLLGAVHAGGLPALLGLIVALAAAVGSACITYVSLRTFDRARSQHDELEAVI